ncbi:uncharacterized protein LOC127239494 [Andrographis paniculata]|uniref:uncharacterized protein LOC127239494 n=1 Tax=Andrographis paniculata TaxID=175694 RepID=UPI0021E78C16|nr:uncharacterized protein LOC127239494 [Andrographis paniculata]
MASSLLQITSQCFCNKFVASADSLRNRDVSKFHGSISRITSNRCRRLRVRAVKEQIEETNTPSSAEDVVSKYGLEAGLWKIFSSKEEENEENKENMKSKGDQAKELLTKYGGAYLATSITISLISFGLCYALISSGVDVQSLLQKVGISPNETGEKVGTFALAYAAHKATSPIRFPPTVALTAVVAKWIGKKANQEK